MSLFQNDPKQDPTATWQQKPSFKIGEEMARTGHKSVVINQYLVIIGGVAPPPWKQDDMNLVVFNLQEETGFQVEISGRRTPGSLSSHSACYWKDNQIIVYGGDAGNDGVLSEVGIITLSSFTKTSLKAEWKTVETDSKRREGHSAHIYQDQMIVIGGVDADENPLDNIDILNLDDFTWTKPKTTGEPPSSHLDLHSSVLYGNEIYVSEDKSLEEMGRGFSCLNLDTYNWKKLPEPEVTPGSLIHFAAMQEHHGKIYLVEKFYPLVGVKIILKSFDLSKRDQGKWNSDFLPKHQGFGGQALSFSLNVYDNQLVVYGGMNVFAVHPSNELWFLKLDDDSAEMQENSIKKQLKEENIIKTFLREAPYSDVIFEVESEHIPAHKWWLCNKSKYFANMFSSGMIEAKSSKIVISDMNAATFRAFLEYLYSDDVELDVNLAKDLLTQADKYSIPALKELCENFLLGHIEPNNYVLLANLAELLEANKLRDAVRDFIAKNIKALKARKDFEEISMDMLRDVVIKATVR